MTLTTTIMLHHRNAALILLLITLTLLLLTPTLHAAAAGTATLLAPSSIPRSSSSSSSASLNVQLSSAPSNNAQLSVSCQNSTLSGTPVTGSTGTTTSSNEFILSLIQPRVGVRFCQVRNSSTTIEVGSILIMASQHQCPFPLTYELDGRSGSQADEPDLAAFYQGCCGASSFFQIFDFRGRVPIGRQQGSNSFGSVSGSDQTSTLNSANFMSHHHGLSNSNGFTSLWPGNNQQQPLSFSHIQSQVAIDWAICSTTTATSITTHRRRRRNLLSVSGCTLGEMRLVAGSPQGSWKLANGISVVQKASGLGKIINGQYGTSGQSYFLPNMQGLQMVGTGIGKGLTLNATLGSTGGLISDTLTDFPQHTHSIPSGNGNGNGNGSSSSSVTLMTAGTSMNHTIRQPYMSFHYIIAVNGNDLYAPGVTISSTPFYGEIRGFIGPIANFPSGFRLCDGATLLQSDYPGLFNVIGTSYGTSDPATNFFLPDLRGRTLVGAIDVTTANLLGRTPTAVGQYQGSESVVVPLLQHTHTGQSKQWPNTYSISLPTNSYQFTLTEPTSSTSFNDTCTYSLFPELNEFIYSTKSPFTIPVTTPPILGPNQTYTTNQRVTLTVTAAAGGGSLNLLSSGASDADSSDVITIVLDTPPQHGSVTINGDGSFIYTPATNYHGQDEFTYYAFDGYVRSTYPGKATITIVQVNNAPVSLNISVTSTEDTPLTGRTELVSSSSDPDGDALTYYLVAQPSQGGVVTVNSATGLFSFQPTADFNGDVTFSYYTSDGQLQSTNAFCTIHVIPVNDAPTATDDSYTINEDVQLTTTTASSVLANDADIDTPKASLVAVLDRTTQNGTLTLLPTGVFTYKGKANFNGQDSFTYHANDGSLNSAVRTVTITVVAVNDAPTAAADSYSTNEDTLLAVSGALGLLKNDADVDTSMSSLTIQVVQNVATGTLQLDVKTGSFNYTPKKDVNGIVFFTYRLYDGQLYSNTVQVTINITPVNDAPVGTDDAYTTSEDTPLIVNVTSGVLTNDADVDGDVLTTVLLTDVTHGTLTLASDGSFLYSPSDDYNGIDSFLYGVFDGTTYAASAVLVTLTITPVNDAPFAVSDSYTAEEDTLLTVDAASGVLANDGDIDTPSSSLAAVLDGTVSNGTLTLNRDGSFTYQGNLNFNGQDSFSYHVNDGALDSNPKLVIINVGAVEDLPITAADAYTTDEDTELVVSAASGLLLNDQDVDGVSVTAVLDADVAHGTLTLASNGSFVYLPSANFNGQDSFTYFAYDGTANSASTTVTITVTSVNDAPQAADDTYQVTEDVQLTVSAAAGLLANDADVDGDVLTAVLDTTTQNGALTLNADGSFAYQGSANYNGQDFFTYHVNDGLLDSPVRTVSLTIIAANDAPIGSADSYATSEDTRLIVDVTSGVLSNDHDIDSGDVLTAVLYTNVAHGRLELASDGSFDYNPSDNFNGQDSFTYRLFDGTTYSDHEVSVSLTVTPVNDAPIGADDSYTVAPGETLTVSNTNFAASSHSVLTNDVDVDGDILTARLVEQPQHGALTLADDGTFVYTANAAFVGVDLFTYRDFDGQLESLTHSVTITVTTASPSSSSTGSDFSSSASSSSGDEAFSSTSDPSSSDSSSSTGELSSTVDTSTVEASSSTAMPDPSSSDSSSTSDFPSTASSSGDDESSASSSSTGADESSSAPDSSSSASADSSSSIESSSDSSSSSSAVESPSSASTDSSSTADSTSSVDEGTSPSSSSGEAESSSTSSSSDDASSSSSTDASSSTASDSSSSSSPSF